MGFGSPRTVPPNTICAGSYSRMGSRSTSDLCLCWAIHHSGCGTTRYWKNRRFFDRFYYKVILSVPGLIHGLFVELVLTDDDKDLPSVMIVNAHEQLP